MPGTFDFKSAEKCLHVTGVIWSNFKCICSYGEMVQSGSMFAYITGFLSEQLKSVTMKENISHELYFEMTKTAILYHHL